MSESTISFQQQQEQVNTYFQSQAFFWKDIYVGGGVQSQVYRERQARVLAWVDSLALPAGSPVLEIGCGAGFLAIALAQRGLHVQAIDTTQAMLDLTHQHVHEAGVAEQVSLTLGDACTLSFQPASFDLVLALGVIPWLAQPELAIQEMARVTKPGGHVILTANNWIGLESFLDPWRNPIVRILRRNVRDLLTQVRHHHRLLRNTSSATWSFHTRHFIGAALAHVGLARMKSTTIGFGPFSFRWHYFFPESIGLMLHHWLQHLADLGIPLLRSSGGHYLVLARKTTIRHLETHTASDV